MKSHDRDPTQDLGLSHPHVASLATVTATTAAQGLVNPAILKIDAIADAADDQDEKTTEKTKTSTEKVIGPDQNHPMPYLHTSHPIEVGEKKMGRNPVHPDAHTGIVAQATAVVKRLWVRTGLIKQKTM